jgi:hypothetical protein
MSQLAAEMRPGSGGELLDLLEMRGSPEDTLKLGRELIVEIPNMTAMQIYDALKAAGSVGENTLRKAKGLFGELGKPITLNELARRLTEQVISATDVTCRRFFRKFVEEPIPEWEFIKYACEKLFGATEANFPNIAGPKWADQLGTLNGRLRFERKLDNAGEMPLAEVKPHIEALLGIVNAPMNNEEQPLTGAARDAALRALEPASRKAYLAFEYVQSKRAFRLEDREAYNLLDEEGISTGQGNLGDLIDYELPNFDTWSRQLRKARNALQEQKNRRRGRAPTTRSIVKGNQIENQKGDAE